MQALIIKNVEVGSKIYFPGKSDYRKKIKRTVSSISFCTLNPDNIHMRIGYNLNGTIHEPVLDKILDLNPEIETEIVNLELKTGSVEGKYMGESVTLYFKYIEYNGITDRVGRFFIKNGEDVWYIN